MDKVDKITSEMLSNGHAPIIDALNRLIDNQNEIIDKLRESGDSFKNLFVYYDLNQLKKRLSKIENERLGEKNEQFEKVWRRIEKELDDWPKEGGIYFFIDISSSSALTVLYSIFSNDKIDQKRKESGNMFKTEEQAKEAANRIKNVLYYFHNPVDGI